MAHLARGPTHYEMRQSMITFIRHDGVDVFVLQQATRIFDLGLLFGGALPQAVRPSSDTGASPLPPPPSALRRARLAAPPATPSACRSRIAKISSYNGV